jgi:hypothetical protein
MKRLILLLALIFLAAPAYGQGYRFAAVCDPIEGVDGFKLYLALPEGGWETVPYQEITHKGQRVAVVVPDLEIRIPYGITRAYLKTYNAQGESAVKMRTFYRQTINLVIPGAARITESISWW